MTAMTPYTEKCPCGRVVLTVAQAQAHAQHCDDFPGPDDSLLRREGFPEAYDP